jgi:hypothetical protein
MVKGLKILIGIVLSYILTSCNLDIIDKKFIDYKSLRSDNYYNSGWIPKSFIKPSIQNVFHLNNVDTQEAFIRFKYGDSNDFNKIVDSLSISKCSIIFISPKTIKIPDWWIKNIDKLDRFCYSENQINYNVAIDYKIKTIFIWRSCK